MRAAQQLLDPTRPAVAGSVSGKCSPTSPSATAPRSASAIAWQTTSPSECPARPASPSKRTPPSHSGRSGREAVDVEAEPDGRTQPSARAHPRSACARSARRGDLHVLRVARDREHLVPRPAEHRRIVGERGADGLGVARAPRAGRAVRNACGVCAERQLLTDRPPSTTSPSQPGAPCRRPGGREPHRRRPRRRHDDRREEVRRGERSGGVVHGDDVHRCEHGECRLHRRLSRLAPVDEPRREARGPRRTARARPSQPGGNGHHEPADRRRPPRPLRPPRGSGRPPIGRNAFGCAAPSRRPAPAASRITIAASGSTLAASQTERRSGVGAGRRGRVEPERAGEDHAAGGRLDHVADPDLDREPIRVVACSTTTIVPSSR